MTVFFFSSFCCFLCIVSIISTYCKGNVDIAVNDNKEKIKKNNCFLINSVYNPFCLRIFNLIATILHRSIKINVGFNSCNKISLNSTDAVPRT